jgi:parvulin-like peptidyl-prolyl isomerase
VHNLAFAKGAFMKTGMYSGLIVFSLLMSVSPAHAATELARINNTVITLEDFNKKYKENVQFFQYKQPTKKLLLDNIVKRELGIQEAKRLGLDKDPEVLERLNTVLYNALLEKKLSKEVESIHISDDEAQSFYNTNPEVRTSHIFVALRPNATQDEQKKALEKIKRIYDSNFANGKGANVSFAEVAQRFSEGPAAAAGGDLDYQTRDRLDPAYYAAAIKLGTPGKISDIVRSQFGYHIIKLTAIHTWDETDKAAIKRMVFEEQRAKVFEKYMASLRVQAGGAVKIRSELISD